MSSTLQGADVVDAVRRVSQMLIAAARLSDFPRSGDGRRRHGDHHGQDRRGAACLSDANPIDDIGKYLFQLGTATNKAAPSTMGTLTAGALMSAGKVVRDRTELEAGDLAAMFRAADEGIQSRGKAKLGDKTIVDALHPACEAFSAAVAAGSSLSAAGAAAIDAATAGRDSVTPLRSKIGRASWVGERTEGIVDPGCAMFVLALEAIAG